MRPKPTARVAAVLIVAVASLGSAADPDGPETLEEYLRHAALNNAGLKAAFEEWKAALEAVPQAKALPDPMFTYDYFIEQVETRQRAGIMQTFPWFGTIRVRTDAASVAAKATYSRYEAKKLQLFYEVKDAFHEYVYLQRAIEIARDTLDLLRHFEEVARTRYITAAAGHPDIIRAQVEVATLEDRLIALQELREPIVARLNAALNRPVSEPLPWPKGDAPAVVPVDRSDVLARVRQQNPQLKGLDFDAEVARRQVELAKKSFYPSLGLGAEWMKMSRDMGGGDDDVAVMFSLNLPIWRKSYRAAELQARAQSRRTVYQRQDVENDLLTRTLRVLYDLEDSGRKLRLYEQVLVPKAQELVGASETAYSAGTVDFLSLIDAERTLLTFRLERERAKANQQQRLAELEMLVGAEIAGREDSGTSE